MSKKNEARQTLERVQHKVWTSINELADSVSADTDALNWAEKQSLTHDITSIKYHLMMIDTVLQKKYPEKEDN